MRDGATKQMMMKPKIRAEWTMKLIHLSMKKVVAEVFTSTRKIDPGHKRPIASDRDLQTHRCSIIMLNIQKTRIWNT
jgi:hypothetical protein